MNLELQSKPDRRWFDYNDKIDYNLQVMNSLKIGDKVIYPTQGIGIIEDIQEESYNGQSLRTFHIRLLSNNTLVVIPSSSATEIGLRRPISQKQVNKFFQFLKSCSVDISADWKDRYKENFDLMKSGHLEDIAVVFKTLFFLSQTKPLSFREKKMLEKARELIITELAASSCSPPEKIHSRLNQCLSGCLRDFKLGSDL
ncbi:MAG: CarD family transcriptional regulator [Candidatus Saccharicenans sp.]